MVSRLKPLAPVLGIDIPSLSLTYLNQELHAFQRGSTYSKIERCHTIYHLVVLARDIKHVSAYHIIKGYFQYYGTI